MSPPWNVSSPWKSYKALSSRHKLVFGVAVISWGTIGLYISDKAEKKLGFEPTEEDKKALAAIKPKVEVLYPNDRDRD